MERVRRGDALPAAGLLLLVASVCDATTIYQVGNSLTNDSTPSAIRSLVSAALDEPVQSGWHIRSSSSLPTIWERPLSITATGGTAGGFLSALPQESWDHVALQIFPAQGSTLAADLQAARNFMALAETNPENAETVFYVYGPWTRFFDMSGWELPVTEEGEQPTRARRDYYDLVVDRLAEERPGRVRLIPVGEVFHRVAELGAAGELSFVDRTSDLYRDHIHANDIGKFLAATTVAATIVRENPVGWGFEVGLPGRQQLTDEQAAQLQAVIWETLVDSPRAGVVPVGDVNIDTRVDADDHAAWRTLYGASEQLTADVNGDGRVDDNDFATVQKGVDPGAGDLTQDGVADGDDLTVWRSLYGGSLGPDANDDGVVDAADYTVVRDAIDARLVSDLNGDQVVDAVDVGIAQREQGWSTSMRADLNDDGVVDAADYTVWRDNADRWATGNADAVSVPEPASVVGAAMTAAAFVTLRRRPR